MTQAEPTIEMINEVIARFDGWEEWQHEKGLFTNPERNETHFHCVQDFKYDSSWDALMPAWNELYAQYCKIEEHLKERRFYFDYIAPMSNAMITGNITSAHKILYEAINWLNQQSNK
jgi:hypothetical protein